MYGTITIKWQQNKNCLQNFCLYSQTSSSYRSTAMTENWASILILWINLIGSVLLIVYTLICHISLLYFILLCRTVHVTVVQCHWQTGKRATVYKCRKRKLPTNLVTYNKLTHSTDVCATWCGHKMHIICIIRRNGNDAQQYICTYCRLAFRNSS